MATVTVIGRCLRPALPMNRANLRCLGLSVGIAISLSGCGLAPHQPAPEPIYGYANTRAQERQDALAGYLVRLGYDRWTAGCGFHVAKAGGSIEDVKRKCVVDFAAAIAKANAR